MSKNGKEPTGEELAKQLLRQTQELGKRLEREYSEENYSEENEGLGQDAQSPPLQSASANDAAKAKEEEREAEFAAWEKEMHAEADKHGGILPPDPVYKYGNERPQVRLGGLPATPPGAAGDTEALLNGLIAECRFLVHEVAFHSARLTPNPDDRVRFLSAAQELVITGAKIGEAVARLRGCGASKVEEKRHHMVYEHVQTAAAPPSPQGNTP